MVQHPHVAKANDYARAVVAGEISACKWVRKACERHLGDLEKVARRNFAYRFDPEKAEHICRFAELLPHVKGKWAARSAGVRGSNLIRLEPWQCFIFSVLLGWVRKSDGLRRFRHAYLEIPRKNGKSVIAAVLGLYMLAADGEIGAEVYCGATTRVQAFEVFTPAKRMAESAEADGFRAAFGVQVAASAIFVPGNGSSFKPVIGKPGDGASPSCAIVDEFHEHKTAELYDTMDTGTGAREQALIFVITTAGEDIASPCAQLRQEMEKLLDGVFDDPETFTIIYTIDADVDWTTDEALWMANPNLGVSVNLEDLRAKQREAVRNPAKANIFKTKRLNVWCRARSPWMNMEAWKLCEIADLAIEDFEGEECFGALDLASKIDLAPVGRVFRREVAGEEHFYAFVTTYLPEERTSDPTAQHYQTWVDGGYIIPTDGNIIDQDRIKQDLLVDARLYPFAQLGYDPWDATKLALELQAEGIPVVEVAQTVKNLSEAMKWVEALVLAGRFHHDGNPVLRWAMSNVTAKVDANDNVFPRKERAENKIDPAVVIIMAMGRALAADPANTGPSVYEERGMVWF
jgi:phage terminase large subunit-like protein